MTNTRLTLEDSYLDAITKMAEGNPGALTAIMAIAKEIGNSESLIAMLHLDEAGLYGPNIWLGFKDVHKHNVEEFYQAIIEHRIEDEVKSLPYFQESY